MFLFCLFLFVVDEQHCQKQKLELNVYGLHFEGVVLLDCVGVGVSKLAGTAVLWRRMLVIFCCVGSTCVLLFVKALCWTWMQRFFVGACSNL